jgi:hypothetical protein
MSEFFSDEDWAAFEAHIKKFPKAEVCPICEHTDWSVPPVELGNMLTAKELAALSLPPGASPVLLPGFGGGVPVIVLICTTCFYVRHFAWRGVRSGATVAADGGPSQQQSGDKDSAATEEPSNG